MQSVSVPKYIKLADTSFNVPASIDMLIGTEFFWKLICTGQIEQSKNQSMPLQKTHFGWIIFGITLSDITGSVSSLNFHLTSLDDLRLTLNRFWAVEHDTTPKSFSLEEKACEESFLQGVKRNLESRFIVKLPTKQDKLDELGESKDIALKSFKSLEKRLIAQPCMYEYRKFMDEYRRLNHIKVTSSTMLSHSSPAFYLPHHAVQNETSTTTKFRIVFDGSCKTTTELSLNDDTH
ncbi:PREDICTED: uncharacterized protein LOC105151386 [Acromyrmex echinatior]|uniref:uncharacterized protein LOC105151386 n=1 Tax=Acromyrmex echinatior TaxID=103372 RepID=UPI000580E495|nr:PREDICTED: uncharacterized protein LOC105151386 [Acromyrmex echinatior]